MDHSLSSLASTFSGITGTTELTINDVYHKAIISVDEKGTEAAAATGAVMRLTSMPMEPLTFIADRPFIIFIRDNEQRYKHIGRVDEGV